MTEVNFQMQLSPADLQWQALHKVADIVGITTEQFKRQYPPQRLRNLHRASHTPNDQTLGDYTAIIPTSATAREKAEKNQTLGQRLDGVVPDAYGQFASFGIHFPTILDAVANYSKIIPEQKDNPDVLVAGALTADTVSEAYAIAQHCYPKLNFNVVDKSGIMTKERANLVGKFHEGDLLDLPFEASSYDIVMGDFILSQLRSANRSVSLQQRIYRFFINISRILRPGGAIILTEEAIPLEIIESFLNEDRSIGADIYRELVHLYHQKIKDLIQPFGLRLFIGKGKSIRRQHLADVMVGNSWNIPKDRIKTEDQQIGLLAIKG